MNTRLCKSMSARILALLLAVCMAFPGTAFAAEAEIQPVEETVLINEETPTADVENEDLTLTGEVPSDAAETDEDVPTEEAQPEEEAAPETDEEEAAEEEAAPETDKKEPTEEEAAPETDDEEPAEEAQPEEEAAPETDEEVPAEEEAAPEADDEETTEEEAAPETDAEEPADEEAAPETDEEEPTEEEAAPETEGEVPEEIAEAETDQPSESEPALVPNTEDETTCTLSLDLNGGSWIDPDSYDANEFKNGYVCLQGTDCYLPDEYAVERTGYKFLGWTTVKDGADVLDANNYYTVNSDITLYAKWEKLLCLTLDLNGGSWSYPDSYYATEFKNGYVCRQGTDCYLPEEYDVERTGYKFLGWTTTKDGADVLDSEYTVNSDVTLYAKWKKLLCVKLNLNSGSWADSYYKEEFQNGYYAEKNTEVYLPDESAVTRKGYKLIGWTVKKNEGTALTGDYKITKNITLYARWKKTYCVKFNLNGGKWTKNTYYAEAYKNGYSDFKNTEIALPSTSDVTREGYILAGWTTKKNEGTIITDYYTITKDITLYAKWAKPVCVKLNLNGGQWSEDSDYYKNLFKNGQTVAKNSTIYLPSSYYVTRNGYFFKGWTVKKNKGKGIYSDYKATKNITLYALWAKSVTLTLSAGKGCFHGDSKQKKLTFTLEKGSSLGSSYFTSYSPVYSKKVFGGWYKDSKLTKPAKKSDVISKNTTLYPKWLTNTYKITVKNLKGASYTNRATGDYVYSEDSTASSYSFYISKGDKIGYLYAWKDGAEGAFYFDKACKTKPFYQSYVPTKNTTVYAKFNKEVTISWDANGGTSDYGGSKGTSSCKSGLMWEGRPDVVREGYYLVGWYDVKNSSVILPASHVFKKNTSVKAKWKKAVKVTIDPKGGEWYSGSEDTGKRTYYVKPKTALSKYVDYLPTPEKSGYIFSGWKSSLTKKKVKDIFSDKPAKNVTYTAIWTKVKSTVKVTLVAGNGSIYDETKEEYVTKLTIKVPKNKTLEQVDLAYCYHDEPSKKQSFQGWSLKKNGTPLKSSYKFTKNVTLYPIFKKSASFSVALVTNGGAIDDYPNNDPDVWNCEKGTTLSLPTSSRIEREGYTFVGWYTDAKCTKKVSNPSKYKVTKSCYLYAKWKKK